MQHGDIGPSQQRAPLPGAKSIAPARELFRAHLPTGRLQGLDQAAHAVPIGVLLQTIPQQHDSRHVLLAYVVSARCDSAFSAISTPFASFRFAARCAKALRAASSRNNLPAARRMPAAVSSA